MVRVSGHGACVRAWCACQGMEDMEGMVGVVKVVVADVTGGPSSPGAHRLATARYPIANPPSPAPYPTPFHPTMNLTAYSDSESDGDVPPAARHISKPAPQKVVDRTHPGRIIVRLPGAAQTPTADDDIQADAPPAKKPRLGGGGLSGLNAMLPAPKKPSLGRGLASGANLKTGAEPAFQRAPKLGLDEHDAAINPTTTDPMSKDDFRAMLNLPASKADGPAAPTTNASARDPAAEPAPPRFVPMSVGKVKKKKLTVSRLAGGPGDKTVSSGPAPPTSQPLPEPAQPPRKPKVSLFGVSQEAEPSVQAVTSDSYQPLLYGAADGEDAPTPDDAFQRPAHQHIPHTHTSLNPSSSGALSNLASELNLSESERRQLFGKKGKGGPDLSSATIVEFNTDTEYAHNEKLRQQGEQIQHNALKSISGTGKNSLRSLVSAVVTQKDALEDHFAASHRNKREAGHKYGW